MNRPGRPPLDASSCRVLLSPETVAWIKKNRVECQHQLIAIVSTSYRRGVRLTESETDIYNDLRVRIASFDKALQRYEQQLRAVEALSRLESRAIRAARRSRSLQRLVVPGPEPLIEAVPRNDVLMVKAVDHTPAYADHQLTHQIDRRGEVIESWNYRCLKSGHTSRSRRYEGFNPRNHWASEMQA